MLDLRPPGAGDEWDEEADPSVRLLQLFNDGLTRPSRLWTGVGSPLNPSRCLSS